MRSRARMAPGERTARSGSNRADSPCDPSATAGSRTLPSRLLRGVLLLRNRRWSLFVVIVLLVGAEGVPAMRLDLEPAVTGWAGHVVPIVVIVERPSIVSSYVEVSTAMRAFRLIIDAEIEHAGGAQGFQMFR